MSPLLFKGLKCAFLVLNTTMEEGLVALYWSIRWVCTEARNRFCLSLSDERFGENDVRRNRAIFACHKNRRLQREQNVPRKKNEYYYAIDCSAVQTLNILCLWHFLVASVFVK